MIMPALKVTYDNAETAMKNEELTRGRVERLESIVGRDTLWGRLKWLLRGR